MSDAPSKNQAAEILTAETIPAYLQEHCWDDLQDKVPALQSLRPTDLSSSSVLTVTPIAGGNVNYAFCLTFATTANNNTTTVFLKQAPEFVAIFGPDGFPLTSQRMQREINVYHEWSTLLGTTLAARYLPQIYHFDRTYHQTHIWMTNGVRSTTGPWLTSVYVCFPLALFYSLLDRLLCVCVPVRFPYGGRDGIFGGV